MQRKLSKLLGSPAFFILLIYFAGVFLSLFIKSRYIPAVLLASLTYVIYLAVKERIEHLKKRDATFFASITAFSVVSLLAHIVIFSGLKLFQGIEPFLFPYTMVSITVSVIFSGEIAVPYILASSFLFGVVCGFDYWVFSYSLLGGLSSYHTTKASRKRSSLIKGGFISGFVLAAVLIAMFVTKGEVDSEHLGMGLSIGMLTGTLGGLISVGLVPLSEVVFGYTTNLRLLELGTLDHPLLKELAIKAPGTYYHSMLVSTLAEMASEEVKANPLLAKVGAYFHDIGKLKKPDYFVENQGLTNKHSKLSPHMSALILKSHVKDGVELAKSHKLGELIVNIIQQHHGTSLITYFYKKAIDMGEDASEDEFRYPGPKPQTKEAAIIMMADAVEAASRTLSEPTPGRIKGLVFSIINNLIKDGQLDECNLTFKDLKVIGDTFVKVLTGIHHRRIEYPKVEEIRKNEGRTGGKGGKVTPFPGRAFKASGSGKEKSAWKR